MAIEINSDIAQRKIEKPQETNEQHIKAMRAKAIDHHDNTPSKLQNIDRKSNGVFSKIVNSIKHTLSKVFSYNSVDKLMSATKHIGIEVLTQRNAEEKQKHAMEILREDLAASGGQFMVGFVTYDNKGPVRTNPTKSEILENASYFGNSILASIEKLTNTKLHEQQKTQFQSKLDTSYLILAKEMNAGLDKMLGKESRMQKGNIAQSAYSQTSFQKVLSEIAANKKPHFEKNSAAASFNDAIVYAIDCSYNKHKDQVKQQSEQTPLRNQR